MMQADIPFFSAAVANADLDFSSSIRRVLERHWYVLGTEVEGFEREFARYLGSESCVSVANGTDALEIGLRAIGVGPGDRVIAVANAGFYGSTAIHATGGSPLYVEVDPITLTMSPDALAEALQCEPKAVIVTHLYGRLANIEELMGLAKEAGVPVVEDCAQAHGAQRHGKHAGTFGTIGCFSFYPTKNLGAFGDGGAIVTDDDQLAAKIRALRQYGWSKKYHVSEVGGRNSRLDEIQAAVLRLKLPYLDRWNEARRVIAGRYSDAFSSLPVQGPDSIGEDYVAHLYVVRVGDRERFREYLKEHGVGTDIHYPIPDYRQAAYPMPHAKRLVITESACESVVSLPCYPGMTDENVHRVIEAVRNFYCK